MNFFEKVQKRWETKKTLLCVGLDPRALVDEEALVAWAKRVIDETKEHTACYKPNSAFYEALGSTGLRALERIIEYIPEEIPVLLDVKRCDIGATAEAYATACFSALKADAVTLSPYMGRDAVDPFSKYPDKGLFVLARTSNPGAVELQELRVDGEELYSLVARKAAAWSPSVGLVVAGNDTKALAKLRGELPDTWFLAPGIGTQGGDIGAAVLAGARSDGLGILPVVARGITEAENPGAAAAEYAQKLREAVEQRMSGIAKPSAPSLKHAVMEGLISTSCFKKGTFTLKSGKISPFYIDLRRVISNPRVLDTVAKAYCSLLDGLSFDRIAGIPAAALPLATAVALKAGKPMIWPRIPLKDHGTGQRIEGEFVKGERILLLDDLITTGASKLEALEVLRAEGLVVEDLLVLIERGKQGRQDMSGAGVRLRAFFHVTELFGLCEELGLLSGDERRDMERFVSEE